MWDSDGALDAVHATPFGQLPGTVVIDFPTVDAIAHAWDISASVGRPIEFSPEMIPAISSLVDRLCTEPVRAWASSPLRRIRRLMPPTPNG